MKPYKTIKLVEYPDVVDIKNEGRKSSIGRVFIIQGKATRPWRRNNGSAYRGYARSAEKRKTRRLLKKRDRRGIDRQIRDDDATDFEIPSSSG